MLLNIMFETIWGRTILALTVTGILLRMIAILSYKRMKKAAENPIKTKQQWVLLLKKRYESYERFGRVKHVSAFVEHYFSRKGILGIPLSFWDKSSLFLAALTSLSGIGGCLAALETGASMGQMSRFLLLGGAGTILLLLFHILGESSRTKEQILAALTDHLANGTPPRNGSVGVEEKEEPMTKEEVEALSEAAVTEEEKMVLEEVLEDYFW